jgi:DNA topoisomerase I
MATVSQAVKPNQAKRRAAKAGLIYLNSLENGITRQRRGRGFIYKTSNGKALANDGVRQRINALVIPPAWVDVFICSKSNGHIQATGTDEAGRRQYIYHERWTALSTATKFDRMHLFGKLLPKMRRHVMRDLNAKGLTFRRVLAAVVRLLDKAHLRVGNRFYADTNGSRGATTLLPDHVEVERTRIYLNFPGKSSQQQEIDLSDRKVAKVIRECEDIDGQFLFQYIGEDNNAKPVSSSDVNGYLHELGDEIITAKDYRTWCGSVTALRELKSITEEDTKTDRKRKIASAISVTAKELGNTKAGLSIQLHSPGFNCGCGNR